MRFWDSSAIVPLVVPQAHTAAAERLLRDDPNIVVWWTSEVECTAALTRLARDGAIHDEQVQLAVTRLSALLESAIEVDPISAIREVACRLLRVHPLRSADALQLAAALEVRGPSRNTQFVCFDKRLALAARREGLSVP